MTNLLLHEKLIHRAKFYPMVQPAYERKLFIEREIQLGHDGSLLFDGMSVYLSLIHISEPTRPY